MTNTYSHISLFSLHQLHSIRLIGFWLFYCSFTVFLKLEVVKTTLPGSIRGGSSHFSPLFIPVNQLCFFSSVAAFFPILFFIFSLPFVSNLFPSHEFCERFTSVAAFGAVLSV